MFEGKHGMAGGNTNINFIQLIFKDETGDARACIFNNYFPWLKF